MRIGTLQVALTRDSDGKWQTQEVAPDRQLHATAVSTPRVLGRNKDQSGLFMLDSVIRALRKNPHIVIVGFGESETRYHVFYRVRPPLLLTAGQVSE